MKFCPSSKFPFASLADCGEIVTGSTPPKAQADYWGGEIPFVTPAQLGFHQPITSAAEKVTSAGAERGRLLPEGSVLVCCIGSLGKTGVAGVPLISNQQINSIVFDPSKVEARYGYYAARSLTPLLEHFAPSTTIKIVKKSAFANFQIPLPPLAEQKRIAGILDAADALRAKRRESLAQLDTLLQSTFLTLFGDPVTNPMGWEVKKLKDISTKILSGNTPKGGKQVYTTEGITFFRSQNVWKNRIDSDDIAFIDEDIHRKMAKSSLKNRDILITKTGRFNTENSSLGRAAMFLGEDDSANINGHVYLVRLKEGAINEFVLFILTTDQYRDYIRRVCVGGIDKRQINKEHLNEFPIIQPPLDLQNRFATIVKSIERQKARQRAHLAELDALFASLQSRAFNGEL